MLNGMAQKERKGWDSHGPSLSPLFITEPRVEERVWNGQASKSEIKSDELVWCRVPTAL